MRVGMAKGDLETLCCNSVHNRTSSGATPGVIPVCVGAKGG